MFKKIVKKIIIKINRFFGYEIIDQSNYSFPSLKNKSFSELSVLNKKSVVMPLGEIKVSRQVRSLSIILRTNSSIHISGQSKKRIFNKEKIEYILSSINSLAKSINHWLIKNKDFKIIIYIIDQSNNEKTITSIKNILDNYNINHEIILLNDMEFKDEIKVNCDEKVFGNLNSLLKCFKVSKNLDTDLILFLEDDYLHKVTLIEELILTYERISSQIKDELIILPSDYPFYYMEDRNTQIIPGSHRHWQKVSKVLCSFMISKKMFQKYWSNFYDTCIHHHDPIEKNINKICENEICISPIPTLSIHIANSNSIYGISPFVDLRSEWEKNKV